MVSKHSTGILVCKTKGSKSRLCLVMMQVELLR